MINLSCGSPLMLTWQDLTNFLKRMESLVRGSQGRSIKISVENVLPDLIQVNIEYSYVNKPVGSTALISAPQTQLSISARIIPTNCAHNQKSEFTELVNRMTTLLLTSSQKEQ